MIDTLSTTNRAHGIKAAVAIRFMMTKLWLKFLYTRRAPNEPVATKLRQTICKPQDILWYTIHSYLWWSLPRRVWWGLNHLHLCPLEKLGQGGEMLLQHNYKYSKQHSAGLSGACWYRIHPVLTCWRTSSPSFRSHSTEDYFFFFPPCHHSCCQS